MYLVIMMNVFKWFKIRKIYKEQSNNNALGLLFDETIKFFPEIIDVSDGELRGKKGFYSNSLSDVWHNVQDFNVSNSIETDFMIWAIYGELHTKSIQNFKKRIKLVRVSELNRSKILKGYIKECLEADVL